MSMVVNDMEVPNHFIQRGKLIPTFWQNLLFTSVVKMSLIFVNGNMLASSIKVCINLSDKSEGFIVVYVSFWSVSVDFW